MGRKLATFFRQLKHLSFARMKLHINAVHEESGAIDSSLVASSPSGVWPPTVTASQWA